MEWESFDVFIRDMGERPPGTTLDRIKNDGDYGPNNCRWATNEEQAQNRRSNILINFSGKTQCIAAWADELGIGRHTIRWRLKRGWSIELALTTAPMSRQERGLLGLKSRGVI